jgi:plasmid stabilization system protein ParE
MNVLLHPEAEGEFRDAILWYEHQRKGLGLEFVLCIDEAIERIRRSPETYPKVHKAIRRIVVRRFPFALFYEIVGSDIRVLAIFHSRRDPSRWKSRK